MGAKADEEAKAAAEEKAKKDADKLSEADISAIAKGVDKWEPAPYASAVEGKGTVIHGLFQQCKKQEKCVKEVAKKARDHCEKHATTETDEEEETAVDFDIREDC